MKRVSTYLFATLLALTLGATAARADQISTFNVSGTFQSGTALTGSFQLDETNGQVVSGDVFGYEEFNILSNPQQDSSAYLFFLGGADGLYVALWLPGSSLIGYQGGPIGSRAGGNVSAELIPEVGTMNGVPYTDVFDHLETGTATLAPSATPEPSPVLLLGTGIASLAGFARRRKA